jgi:hypothetical protein
MSEVFLCTAYWNIFLRCVLGHDLLILYEFECLCRRYILIAVADIFVWNLGHPVWWCGTAEWCTVVPDPVCDRPPYTVVQIALIKIELLLESGEENCIRKGFLCLYSVKEGLLEWLGFGQTRMSSKFARSSRLKYVTLHRLEVRPFLHGECEVVSAVGNVWVLSDAFEVRS